MMKGDFSLAIKSEENDKRKNSKMLPNVLFIIAVNHILLGMYVSALF